MIRIKYINPVARFELRIPVRGEDFDGIVKSGNRQCRFVRMSFEKKKSVNRLVDPNGKDPRTLNYVDSLSVALKDVY